MRLTISLQTVGFTRHFWIQMIWNGQSEVQLQHANEPFFFLFLFFSWSYCFENTSVLTGRLRRWRHPNYTFQLNNETKSNDSEMGTTDHYHVQEEQVPMSRPTLKAEKLIAFINFCFKLSLMWPWKRIKVMETVMNAYNANGGNRRAEGVLQFLLSKHHPRIIINTNTAAKR